MPTHFQTVDEFEVWERQPPEKEGFEFVAGQIIPKPAMKQDETAAKDHHLHLANESKTHKGQDVILAVVGGFQFMMAHLFV